MPSEPSEASDFEEEEKRLATPEPDKKKSFLSELASPFRSALGRKRFSLLEDSGEIKIGKKYLYVLEVGSIVVSLMEPEDGKTQVLQVVRLQGPGEIKQLREEQKLEVHFSNAILDLEVSENAVDFVGFMINKLLMGMWKSYAIRPDRPLMKKKSSDRLIDILANKEILQQRLVQASFDSGSIKMKGGWVLRLAHFGFEFLKFSELKRMKFFLPTNASLLLSDIPLFQLEELPQCQQDSESDALQS